MPWGILRSFCSIPTSCHFHPYRRHKYAVRVKRILNICFAGTFAQNVKSKQKKDMEVVTIEKKTYETMMERFRVLAAKVDALCRECDEKRMGRWPDNQDVCQILNISLRTLQTYRSNRMLPYTQTGYKMFYKPEDVGKLLEQSSAL